jgi:hypothetical protein
MLLQLKQFFVVSSVDSQGNFTGSAFGDKI